MKPKPTILLLTLCSLALALAGPISAKAEDSIISEEPGELFKAKEFSIDIGLQQSVPKANLFDAVDDGILSYSMGMNYFFTKHVGAGLSYDAPFPSDHPGDGKFLIQTASISGIVRYPIKRVAFYGLGGGGRDWHEGEYTYHVGGGLDIRIHNGLGSFIEARYTWTRGEEDTAQLRAGLRVAKW